MAVGDTIKIHDYMNDQNSFMQKLNLVRQKSGLNLSSFPRVDGSSLNFGIKINFYTYGGTSSSNLYIKYNDTKYYSASSGSTFNVAGGNILQIYSKKIIVNGISIKDTSSSSLYEWIIPEAIDTITINSYYSTRTFYIYYRSTKDWLNLDSWVTSSGTVYFGNAPITASANNQFLGHMRGTYAQIKERGYSLSAVTASDVQAGQLISNSGTYALINQQLDDWISACVDKSVNSSDYSTDDSSDYNYDDTDNSNRSNYIDDTICVEDEAGNAYDGTGPSFLDDGYILP